ncbi:MAG: hypothetical protein KatS3mg035_1383 [Bacteroidia bacterium]|nr:MAG: hypothetical protein KatS3mg035_1383 [Bacteroidia bacterium]
MHHYGWVKSPEKQLLKQKHFNKFWHNDDWIHQNIPNEVFDYSRIDKLELFQGTHPQVMQKRIIEKNWKFEMDLSKDNRDWKTRILDNFEKLTGIRLFEYKNYQLIS